MGTHFYSCVWVYVCTAIKVLASEKLKRGGGFEIKHICGFNTFL